jgi:hypothetical protein
MRFLLGTDEAGYGPNLGPLVVAASAWQVPRKVAAEKLYDCLGEVICREQTKDGDQRLAIADSKQLYHSGASLGGLERGVLAMLSLLGRGVVAWKDVWPCFGGESHSNSTPTIGRGFDGEPWHDGYDEPLPVAVAADELARTVSLVADGCRSRQVSFLGLEAAVVSPRKFNDALAEYGNKAEVLSLTTLRLARKLIDALPPGDVQVVCDKHGGRSYYAALLQHVFEADWIVVRQETAELGVYDVEYAGRAVEFRFLVQGERMLPTAHASMTAKYLRELSMRAFNAFWKQHVPGLKPTAGYSTDSRRFRADIRAAQKKLKIADRDLWREK